MGELFEKQIGPESDYAESWELVDREPEQSRVVAGPLAGKTLRELLREYPDLQPEDITACLTYAAELVAAERVYPVSAAGA